MGKQEALFFCEFSYFLFLIFLGVSFSWMRHGYAGFGGSGDYASRYRFIDSCCGLFLSEKKDFYFFCIRVEVMHLRCMFMPIVEP